MNDEVMREVWERGKEREPRLEPEVIRDMLGASVRRGWPGIRREARVFGAMLVAALVLDLLSLFGPDRRPAWVAVRIALLVVIAVLAAGHVFVVRRLRELDEPAVELSVLVRRQLAFFQGTYEWWLWGVSVTVWILSFAVTGWVEDRSGGARIVAPVEFALVSVAQVLIVYVLLRFAHGGVIQQTVAALADLQAQVLDETRRVDARRGGRRAWRIVFAFLLAASVGLGLAVWLGSS